METSWKQKKRGRDLKKDQDSESEKDCCTNLNSSNEVTDTEHKGNMILL